MPLLDILLQGVDELDEGLGPGDSRRVSAELALRFNRIVSATIYDDSRLLKLLVHPVCPELRGVLHLRDEGGRCLLLYCFSPKSTVPLVWDKLTT